MMDTEVKSGEKSYLLQIALYSAEQDETAGKDILARIARGCFILDESTDNSHKRTRWKMDRDTTTAFLNSLPYERGPHQIEGPMDLPEQNRVLHRMTVALLNAIFDAFSGPDAAGRWRGYCDANGFAYSTKVFE